MSPLVADQQDEYVGVRRASQLAGCSMYAVQKFAIVGIVRTKLLPPFRTVYNRADLEAAAQAFAQS